MFFLLLFDVAGVVFFCALCFSFAREDERGERERRRRVAVEVNVVEVSKKRKKNEKNLSERLSLHSKKKGKKPKKTTRLTPMAMVASPHHQVRRDERLRARVCLRSCALEREIRRREEAEQQRE